MCGSGTGQQGWKYMRSVMVNRHTHSFLTNLTVTTLTEEQNNRHVDSQNSYRLHCTDQGKPCFW